MPARRIGARSAATNLPCSRPGPCCVFFFGSHLLPSTENILCVCVCVCRCVPCCEQPTQPPALCWDRLIEIVRCSHLLNSKFPLFFQSLIVSWPFDACHICTYAPQAAAAAAAGSTKMSGRRSSRKERRPCAPSRPSRGETSCGPRDCARRGTQMATVATATARAMAEMALGARPRESERGGGAGERRCVRSACCGALELFTWCLLCK